MLYIACVTVFPALMLIAAIKDATSYTIPNWISLALLAAFLIVAPFALAPSAIAAHLGVGAAALLIGMVMFALRWVGGGDAKLIAAACVWLAGPALLPFLMGAALSGGALTLGLVMARNTPIVNAYLRAQAGWTDKLFAPGSDVPYGLAISAGALIAFPHAPVFKAFAGG